VQCYGATLMAIFVAVATGIPNPVLR
jgi:hypothetical protein